MNAAAQLEPDPKSWPKPPADQHEAIRRRAEEIYIRNGRIAGRDLENWTQAEKEIQAEAAERAAAQASHRAAIVVTVDGVKYVGEYDPALSDGYTPGEFAKGTPVRVRFDGDRMFVRRPNGKELEARIVKKSG
jgi:hypothetical protein